MRMLAMLVVSFLLTGCVTLEEPVFGRIDCRLTGHPELEAQQTLDRQVCLGRATALAARRSGGSIEDVRHGTMLACMGERGYIYQRRREHDARCARMGRPVLAAPTASPPGSPVPAPPASAPARTPQPAPAQAAEDARCRAIADSSERLRCFLRLQQQRAPQ